MPKSASIKKQDALVIRDWESLSRSLTDSDVPFGVAMLSKDSIELSDGDQKILCINVRKNIKPEPNYGKVILCGEGSDLQGIDDFDFYPLSLPISFPGLVVQLSHFFSLKYERDAQVAHVESADKTLDGVRNVLSISRELNGVRDIDKLLNLILAKIRLITHADAGSIYKVDLEKGVITFKITQNDSIVQNLREFNMDINDKSIVGRCVLSQQAIAIGDLYKLNDGLENNPHGFVHDTSWDKRTGYACHSMLSIPIFNISHQVIGVVQLINRRKKGYAGLKSKDDFANGIMPFSEQDVDYAEILAHQAGIALENAYLTQEKEDLFTGFVNASVHAIEQRDPTTSGHSHRVADLSLALAEAVNRSSSGAYAQVYFNANQIKEIRYASLLHDFGKIGVSENVLVKEKKLYPQQLEMILDRFELIKGRLEVDFMHEKIKFLENPTSFPPGFSVQNIEQAFEMHRSQIDADIKFILASNEPTVLPEGSFGRLREIGQLCFKDSSHSQRPFLLQNEIAALSVAKGSLTTDEFRQIQNHVVHTHAFLQKIPWGKDLGAIPEIAGKHHEKLDGSGYPDQIKGDLIPAQSRIMTITDIFDALTAADRPYKKAVPIEKALDILEMEVKAGKCDEHLFKIFLRAKCWENSHQ